MSADKITVHDVPAEWLSALRSLNRLAKRVQS